MIHDLFLMHANLSLEAYTGRNFNHRALTFTEMAASCKHRASSASKRANRTARKNIFLAIIEGVART
jgi:hypothetical protein